MINRTKLKKHKYKLYVKIHSYFTFYTANLPCRRDTLYETIRFYTT